MLRVSGAAFFPRSARHPKLDQQRFYRMRAEGTHEAQSESLDMLKMYRGAVILVSGAAVFSGSCPPPASTPTTILQNAR